MNRLLSIALGLLLLPAAAFSQTTQGTNSVGINLSHTGALGRGHHYYDIALNPMAGRFVKDNWLVGAQVNIHTYGSGGKNNVQSYRGNSIGLSALTRYYFPRKNKPDARGRFYGEATLGYAYHTYDGTAALRTAQSFGVIGGLGLGYNYFLSKNIALEVGAKLRNGQTVHIANKIIVNTIQPEFYIGIQLFSGKKSR